MTSPLRQVGKRNTPVVGHREKSPAWWCQDRRTAFLVTGLGDSLFLGQSFESLLLGHLFIPSGPAFAIMAVFLVKM